MTRSAIARSFAGVAALLIVLTGCVTGSGGTAPSAPPTSLIDQDFPDPDVVHTGSQYVAFAINSPAHSIQEATSPDLVH
jgi:arabinan endo-1,5-alpha-L-arabinosidase